MTNTDAHDVARCWDAGDAGCGRLIFGLKREIDRIEAGELLEVTASDPAASIDLPVWCALAGHVLITEAHPTYVLKRKHD